MGKSASWVSANPYNRDFPLQGGRRRIGIPEQKILECFQNASRIDSDPYITSECRKIVNSHLLFFSPGLGTAYERHVDPRNPFQRRTQGVAHGPPYQKVK